MSDSIVWLGECERSEFAGVVQSLQQQVDLRIVRSVKQATGPAPSHVIVALSRPGEITPQEISELVNLWPQSQLVWLLGEWCCGEKRRNAEFGGANVFYLHELSLPLDVSQLTVGSATVGRACEMAEIPDVTNSGATDPNSSLVAIYSRSRSYRGALADAMSLAGMSSIELQLGDGVRTHGVNFVIWEPASAGDRRQAELREIRRRHPTAEIVALLSWPRQYESEMLRAEGVCVLGQPFALRELFRYFSNYRPRMVSSAA